MKKIYYLYDRKSDHIVYTFAAENDDVAKRLISCNCANFVKNNDLYSVALYRDCDLCCVDIVENKKVDVYDISNVLESIK